MKLEYFKKLRDLINDIVIKNYKITCSDKRSIILNLEKFKQDNIKDTGICGFTEKISAIIEKRPFNKNIIKKIIDKIWELELEILNRPLTVIKGVGEIFKKQFNSKGIFTVLDLFFYFPYRHVEYKSAVPISELSINDYAVITGRILDVKSKPVYRTRRNTVTIRITDNSAILRCVWFNQNKFFAKSFKPQDELLVRGKISFYNGLTIINPEYEILTQHQNNIKEQNKILLPVYSLPDKISGKIIKKIIKQSIDTYSGIITDPLPSEIRKKYNFLSLDESYTEIHFPQNKYKSHKSLERFIFTDFFMLQLVFAMRRHFISKNKKGISFDITKNRNVTNILKNLDFDLTDSQKKSFEEIKKDLNKPRPMNRLLQGDVGSGKTIIALLTAAIVIENGYQAAVMVPTEILAEQHYLVIEKIMRKLNIKSALLTGSASSKNKKNIKSMLSGNEIDIVVGTHSLLEEDVNFKKLGLVIIDEQHKFGVDHRSRLINKSVMPDCLTMTATPIPRTLSFTLFGDLDVSNITELPSGRKKIISKTIPENKISGCFDFIIKQVNKGFQAYIVYPLVEESEKMDIKAAVTEYKKLKKSVFKNISCGLIHGKLNYKEKQTVMEQFNNKKIQILFTTIIVEVGLDVANAAVILVNNADRFGLAQLHQLRGRIGRSSFQSYAFFIKKENITDDAAKRFEIIEKYSDGFKLAEHDLKLRGAGEFLGTRQSGLSELSAFDILKNIKIMIRARNEAEQIVGSGAFFSFIKYNYLLKLIKNKYKDRLKYISIS